MSEQDRQPGSRLGRGTLIRDTLSWVGGWVLVFLEVSRPEVRDAVLLFAGSLITVPAAAIGVTSVVEAVVARRGGTGGSSSPQQEPPASQGSSSL